MNLTSKISILSFFCLLFITACDKEDPDVVEPPELITTVNVTLNTSMGGPAVGMSFRDLDGDGGMEATTVGGTVAANTTYTGSIELLNESISPSESITEEIQEEDEEHQFFFESSIPGVDVAYNDQDADGNPIGLSFILTTGDVGSGDLTITLKHEPEKFEDGVADGDITNAGGETDIEVTFPVDVQ